MALCVLAVGAANAAENRLANGDFKESHADGHALHWPGASEKVAYIEEDGTRFMRLTSVEPGKMILAYRQVPVAPGEQFKLSFRVRYNDVQVGKDPWNDARVMLEFRDNHTDGKKLPGAPGAPNFKGTTAEWRVIEREFTAPYGAQILAVMPCLFNVKAGTVDFADFALVKTGEVAVEPPPPPPPPPAPSEVGELVPNGDFQQANAVGQPAHWPGANADKGVSYPEENGNRFLRLNVVKAGETVMVYREFGLDDRMDAIKFAFDVRCEGIERGENSWFDGRIMLEFRDGGNNKVGKAPGAPNWRGTRAEWSRGVRYAEVPDGAKKFVAMFSLFNAKAGQLDFDNVSLVYVDASEVPAPPPPMHSEYVPPPPAEKLPPMLKAQGNRLVDPDGKEVWLQGVSLASLGWSGTGEYITRSIGVALKDWNVNVIRLAVNSKFWFGRDEYQKDGGEAYRRTVDSAINLAAAHGAYTVLDLHHFRAVMDRDVEFWQDAAVRYKNHPAVIFELLNEPHDISWEVWRNGGAVKDQRTNTEVIAENNEKLIGFMSVGMQKLLEIVRATGANNLVVVGALDWSYDLSGILKGFALEDTPEGNGIMYSTHVYNWKHGWQKAFLDVAEKHPIFVGECGASGKPMDFLVKLGIKEENPHTWVPDFLAVVQKHRLNWTAWCFHPSSSPCLLKDWTYEPTDYWGVYAKRALHGEIFPMGKLR